MGVWVGDVVGVTVGVGVAVISGENTIDPWCVLKCTVNHT